MRRIVVDISFSVSEKGSVHHSVISLLFSFIASETVLKLINSSPSFLINAVFTSASSRGMIDSSKFAITFKGKILELLISAVYSLLSSPAKNLHPESGNS